MNILKHWYLKYIAPAFEPANKDFKEQTATRPASYNQRGQKLTALSWGGFNVKLRKQYR